ncbi:MAG: hypothetical protein HGA72_04080 [Chlorobiaceae bacterium]|nr:hypothetical protein [Chlorobiaceae bacterium]
MRTRLPLFVLLFFLFLADAQQAFCIEFSSREGAFSIVLPGEPVQTKKPVHTAFGVLDEHQFSRDQNSYACLVTYSDYPEAVLLKITDPGKLLDSARDITISDVQGKLVGESAIMLGSYPGRDVKIILQQDTAIVRGRLYLAGNRLYQILVLSSKEIAYSNEINQFLDSFRLLQ